jgi:hypothetical protein
LIIVVVQVALLLALRLNWHLAQDSMQPRLTSSISGAVPPRPLHAIVRLFHFRGFQAQ